MINVDDIILSDPKLKHFVYVHGGSIGGYFHDILHGRNNYPPKVRDILDKYGNKKIRSIVICRVPVSKFLTNALNAASFGQFNKNVDNSPYDKLFHLFIKIIFNDAPSIILEKNEVINSDVIGNKPLPPNTETKIVSSLPLNLTPNIILDNAKNLLGDSFFKYSAKNANCQHFIMAILKGSNIGSQQDIDFVKQNTEELFENLTGLRKLSNSITDLASSTNVLLHGQGFKFNKLKKSFKK